MAFLSAKIFLSYSRGDDEPFVWRLYEGLKSAGFTVWFDRVSMPSRQLTFHQEIRDAVTGCDRLVFVVGPRAIASDYVSQEWRFAYFEALKCVNPIIRLGGYDLLPEDLKLFHAEDFQDDAQFERHLANLVRQLSEASPQSGNLVGVPGLPPYYVDQAGRVKDLSNLLLADLQKPVVLTGAAACVGLQGMGGIGKSVLASALVRHPVVRRAFPEGVYWLTLGQEPNILELQQRLARDLGDAAAFTTAAEGEEKLRTLFADRAALLILDNVWRRPEIAAFSMLGSRGRLLLTSRDASLLRAVVAPQNCYPVELPPKDEAKTLLAKAADVSEKALPAEADSVIEVSGRLPLALALSGGMVRSGTRWGDLLAAIREHDLEWLADPHPAEEQHASIWRTMDASIRVLPEEQRDRFTELAVFAAGGAPDAAIETLWEHTAGLSPRHARGLLAEFNARSLITLSSDSRQVTLHDLLRNFAAGMAVKRFGSESAVHQRLLDAYAAHSPTGWPSGPNDGYFFEHLPSHLDAAGHSQEVRTLLTEFAWINNKLQATNIGSVLADFDRRTLDEDARFVASALRLSAGSLATNATQLAGQLLGRLLASASPGIQQLLQSAVSALPPNMLRPIVPSLKPPGIGLFRTFSTDDSILAVAVTPDGSRIVAGSHFGKLRAWLLECGSQLYSVQGHSARIRAIAISPDGRHFVSTGEDRCIKVWELENGIAVRSLAGHKENATDVAVSPDSNRIISGSTDGSLIVWDFASGSELQRFTYREAILALAVTPAGDTVVTGHSKGMLACRDLVSGAVLWTAWGHKQKMVDSAGRTTEDEFPRDVSSLALTKDGTRVISGGYDGTLQVWALKSGACLNTLRGHDLVLDVDVTPDGLSVVSCGLDKIVCIWDLASGKWVRLLRGHTEKAFSVVASPIERRVISGGDDRTVRIWELDSGPQLPAPRGHPRSARCLAATANGRYVLSGSEDGTIKKWDRDSGEELASFNGHGSAIWAIGSSATGSRAIAGFYDGWWTAWNMENGTLLGSRQAHHEPITSVAMTPDGRWLIVGSFDATLSLWNLDTGEKAHQLIGHCDNVMSVAMTPDGKWALSGSKDRGALLWDLTSGNYIRVLSDHTDWVMAVGISGDAKRALTSSFDGTLRLWDLKNGKSLHVFAGRAGGITTLAVTPDFRRAVSGSEGYWLEVWDLDNMSRIAAFAGDAEFRATVISPDGYRIVAGDQLGRLHFLQLQA